MERAETRVHTASGPPEDPVELGRRLRAARRRRGLTQGRLAAAVTARAAARGERLTLSPSAVSRWEAGIFAPAVRYRPHLEAVLGVRIGSTVVVPGLGAPDGWFDRE